MDDTSHIARASADDLATYAQMLRLRRFEEKAGLLYAMGTLLVPCPLSIGQEAAMVGIAHAMGRDDGLVAEGAPVGLALALGRPVGEALQAFAVEPEAGSETNCWLTCSADRGLDQVSDLRSALSDMPGGVIFAVIRSAEALGAVDEARSGAGQVLPVLVVPRDQWPGAIDVAGDRSVREIDGGDCGVVTEALLDARRNAGTGQLLVILTPPYAGHQRSAGARAASRKDAPDPLKTARQKLLASGEAGEAELLALETQARDEMAAAARLLTAACGD